MNSEQYFLNLMGQLKRVAIVALGPSSAQWLQNACAKDGSHRRYDHVWTVNRGGRVFQADIVFCMDHMGGEEDLEPGYPMDLVNTGEVVVTSDQIPPHLAHGVVRYPIEAIAQYVDPHPPYFLNSIPYLVVLASYLGVRELTMYGCDYTQGGAVAEAGRSNVEYWCGVVREKGMRIGVPSTSSLLSSNVPPTLYGYARPRSVLRLWPYLAKAHTDWQAETDTQADVSTRSCDRRHGPVLVDLAEDVPGDVS